jgi:predicted ArsR family transcriptional regulator
MPLIEAIADPVRLGIVRFLSERAAATPAEIADGIGVHLNTVRAHLPALEAAGVLESAERPASGRGRRPVEYSVADGSVIAATDFFALAELLAAAVVRSDIGAAELRALGVEWGAFIAGRPGRRDAPAAAGAALERLGFQARAGADRVDTVGCPCPLLAPDRPDVVCTLACGVVEGVLRATGGEQRVASHDNDPGRRACTIHLQPRQAITASS